MVYDLQSALAPPSDRPSSGFVPGCCLCWFGAALRGGLGGERQRALPARERRRRKEEPELAGLGVRLIVLQPAREAQRAAKPDAPLEEGGGCRIASTAGVLWPGPWPGQTAAGRRPAHGLCCARRRTPARLPRRARGDLTSIPFAGRARVSTARTLCRGAPDFDEQSRWRAGASSAPYRHVARRIRVSGRVVIGTGHPRNCGAGARRGPCEARRPAARQSRACQPSSRGGPGGLGRGPSAPMRTERTRSKTGARCLGRERQRERSGSASAEDRARTAPRTLEAHTSCARAFYSFCFLQLCWLPPRGLRRVARRCVLLCPGR